MKITREDFDLWLASPVTEAVRKCAGMTAEEAKQTWIDMSWNGGVCDPARLAELKGVFVVADDFANFEFENLPEEMRDDGKQERHPADRI